LGLPAQLTGAAMAFNVTAADSVEVVNVALALAYPGLPSADTLRYPQSSVGVVWNDEITSPLNASVSPIGAPFVRHLEVVDGTAFPGNNVSAVALNKPTAVQVRSFNPANYSAES